MHRRVVLDGVDRVEAKAVDSVVAHPQLRILDRPLAHADLRIVERVAPGRRAEPVGEVWAERAQRLIAGAGVVVDDVENDTEALPMRSVDEARERLRPAVDRVRCGGVEPVISPATLAGERRDRHQLDRRHAQLAERREPRDDAVEGALARERTDVELVEDELAQVEPRPGRDLEPGRVEDARRPAHSLGLPARARIGPGVAVDEHVVVVPRPQRRLARPEAASGRLERVLADRDRVRIRCPDPELRQPRCERNRAESGRRRQSHRATVPNPPLPPSAGRAATRPRRARRARARSRTPRRRGSRRRRACSAPPRART